MTNGKFKNLSGNKYGKLKVINISKRRGNRDEIFWDCICDCGMETSVKTSHLKGGNIKSCGMGICRLKHGFSNNGKRVKGYNTWDMMKQRCYNPKHDSFCDYGERGISVCDRWLDKKHGFANFISDMGERPSIRHSLDRYPDVNGNYCPENCRWGTTGEQARGKRNNVWIEYNGERKIQKDWAAWLKISSTNLRYLLKTKSFEDIVIYWNKKLTREINLD